jgi:VTC domain
MRSSLLASEAFQPVTLAELEASAGLLDRVDNKYVVPVETLAAVAERLPDTHGVLDIDGVRAFDYRTMYYDTPELDTYRDHVQGRRRRYKSRSRHYVDSGGCSFELKLKGLRGRTVKHRIPYDPELHGSVSAEALDFVRAGLQRAYGRAPRCLEPVLHMSYRRTTLVDVVASERLTCDEHLRFHGCGCGGGALRDGVVILESKSRDGAGLADRLLQDLGIRPIDACSKYCLGVGMTRADVRANLFRPVLRRWFAPVPAAAAA